MKAILEKHPGISLGVVAVCLIAGMMFAIHSMRTTAGRPVIMPSTYYTCDDGKTVFKDDDPHHVAPFDHDGHEAVQACFVPGGKIGQPESIWYLTKMTAAYKKRVEASLTGPVAGSAADSTPVAGGQLIKRPGDVDWLPIGDPKAADILKLTK